MIDLLVVAHAPILRVNRRVYRRLAKRGWSVELALPEVTPFDESGRRAEAPAGEDPPLHLMPVWGTRLRYCWYVGLRQLLDSRCPRMVLLENDPDSVLAWRIGAWTRAHNSVLLCQTNENDLPPVIEGLRQGRLRAVVRRVRSHLQLRVTRSHVAHVFTITREGQGMMESLVGPGCASTIPLGFDEELFRPDPALRRAVREELGLVNRTVAYFGRLAPEKGVHLLVEALGRLRDLGWHLLMDRFDLQSDYARKVHDTLERTGVAERTRFFEAAHEEVPRFMNAADIVVVPTVPWFKEQYGRVAPEAQACGCLVIASRIGGLAEIVGDNGLLVPPGDLDALTAGLRRALLGGPELERMRLAGCERAQRDLTLDQQTVLMDEIFRRYGSPGSPGP